MKKILVLTIIICILLGGFAIAYNPQIGDKIGDIFYSDIEIFINGEQVQCFNINGRTGVYVEAFSEAYHDVTYDEDNRRIYVNGRENYNPIATSRIFAEYKVEILDGIDTGMKILEDSNKSFTQIKVNLKNSKDYSQKAKEEMYKTIDNEIAGNNEVLAAFQNLKVEIIIESDLAKLDAVHEKVFNVLNELKALENKN